MASLLGIGFKYATNWEYVTSEDVTFSVFAALSFGTFVLQDQVNNTEMRIKYRCLGVGNGKGLPVNFSRSSFNNSSGSFGKVVSDRYFDDYQFPCRGYIFGAGGGGLLSDGDAPNSASANIVLFGQIPVFAGMRIWGTGGALLPGVGLSAGLAHFWIE